MAAEKRAGVRVRTTVAATLVVAVALVLGAVALVLALRDNLTDAAEQSAETRAEELASTIESQGLAAVGSTDQSARDDDGGDRREDRDDDVPDVIWQVQQEGTVVASNWSGSTLAGDEDTARIDDDRFSLAREEADGYDVVVGASLESADDSVGALVPLLGLGLPLAIALLAGTTWVVTGRALRPVERLREQVDRISARELDQRVDVPPTRDELSRLATTMNHMLERLDHSATVQRQFVSDTSHELRSPLASLKQTAEVARAHPGALDEGELTTAVLEETARMQHLVDQMLVLTRTEEGSRRAKEEVDMDDLLLTEAARVRRERSDLTIETDGVGPARTHGDAQALARVVRNLVDNAARHASARVRLSVNAGADHLLLTVDDDGSGIPADQRERVFERFVRLDEARSRDAGGSGLGLAIVREVVLAHGGTAIATGSDLGGARFEITLPAS